MTTTSPSRNVATTRAADDTCGFRPFPITTLRFPVEEALPLRCFDPRMTCGTSGTYKGCFSTIPTTCRETSTLATSCEPEELCCGTGTYSVCWTWLSMEEYRTFSLFMCSTASGIGTLMPDSTMAKPSSRKDPLTITDLPRTNTDATATASPAGTYATTTGAPAVTKTGPSVPGPTSQTPEGGGEASIGAVVGSIIGALALMGLLLGAAVFMWIRSGKKDKRKREAAESETISPVTGPDGIIVVPYRSYTSVSAPPSYDGRLSGGTEEAKSTPPRRPARSPERKMNVTEGGWI
ncbi:hypothetical protein LX32DRAFT_676879 [Colletotrichum zoysiae]|uniref:Uncharacterized protein n=1 Tax=Colletotrichum zoysiae TaxID=1216348 RepID=A0AAD9H6H2_9PEZI|nr:hypothetical protein LX32DRAFT_676879 [Colletotrichum zoysiae]